MFKRTLALTGLLLLSSSASVLAQVAGDVGTFECRAVQKDAQQAVLDGEPFKNKGQRVRTAAHVVSAAEDSALITESCSGCIVRQFGKGVGVAGQSNCGPDPVCGDGVCSIGESFYTCSRDCGGEVIVGVSDKPVPRMDSCGASNGRLCESLLGNVVADAMRAGHPVDFTITNSGGIRADLTCPPAGEAGTFCVPYAPPPYPITRAKVFSVLPFLNTVVTLSVTGAELEGMLENGVFFMPVLNGRFPQVSGLCMSYDIQAAPGARVMGAVRQAADGSCTGAAVDLSSGATYMIAINDFMATGGDGYPDFTGRFTVHEILDQAVADYIAAQTPISPSIQGRIVCTDSDVGTSPNCPPGPP